MKTPAKHLCSDLSELAGLQWSETIDYQFIDAEPSEVDKLDPFFESLGRWNESTRTVQVFRNRCHHVAARFHASLSSVEQVVLVHHCAHAVTQLGVLPETGKTYIRFGDPAKAFKHENYPLKPTHEFYNDLIREEERFAQIFAYLLLVGKNDSEELRVFNSLSQGHCGLYEIAACNLVRGELRHDWRQEVINDQRLAIQCAARTLATKTRGSQNNKCDLQLFCDVDE